MVQNFLARKSCRWSLVKKFMRQVHDFYITIMTPLTWNEALTMTDFIRKTDMNEMLRGVLSPARSLLHARESPLAFDNGYSSRI
jgi:hypothetical protein